MLIKTLDLLSRDYNEKPDLQSLGGVLGKLIKCKIDKRAQLLAGDPNFCTRVCKRVRVGKANFLDCYELDTGAS